MFDLPKIKITVRSHIPSASVEKIPFEIDSQGCKLRGFILRPQRAGRLPAVIVSHGFGSCTRDTKKYARVFADEGFAAVCFDFCMSGSGKSSGSSLGMSVLTEKTDLLNVLDYVKRLDFVDPDHITLAGCSQGGLVSALAAAEREAEVERLVLYYPALCIPDDARRGQMINAKFDPDHVPEQFRALFICRSPFPSGYSLPPWSICRSFCAWGVASSFFAAWGSDSTFCMAALSPSAAFPRSFESVPFWAARLSSSGVEPRRWAVIFSRDLSLSLSILFSFTLKALPYYMASIVNTRLRRCVNYIHTMRAGRG